MRDIATLKKTVMAEASGSMDPARKPLAPMLINNIFKMLHGYYGAFFLSKFSTGQIDQAGHDKGVASARSVWAYHLREFSEKVIGAALNQCIERHPEFPPSLPQFLALCKANQPRVTHAEKFPVLPDHAPRTEQAAKLRELRNRISGKSASEEPPTISNSLDELKVRFARAAALAGHDEAAVLRELDFMLAPRAQQEKV